MDPAKIRLAEPAPPYCAACFQAKPKSTHVDFGASYDGPMLPALKGAVGVIGQSIDDLVICEDCIQHAAALVGLGDVADLEGKLQAKEDAIDRLHDRIAALEEVRDAREDVAQANAALAALTQRAKPSRRAKKTDTSSRR
jgi:hypothetical protein